MHFGCSFTQQSGFGVLKMQTKNRFQSCTYIAYNIYNYVNINIHDIFAIINCNYLQIIHSN